MEVGRWDRVRRPSLGELYQAHSHRAVRLAYVLVGDDETAQDLVHEAFLKLFGRYRDLRDGDHFEAYLRRTIINLSKNHHRRRRHERSALQRTHQERPPSRDDRMQEVAEILMRLPERQRAAMALRYLEDLSEQETADVMGTTVSAVKSLTQRGSTALREHLRGGSGE